MTRDILYLSNSANWESHSGASYTAGTATVNGRTIYAPILEFTLPISFEKRIIAIAANSNSSKPTWNFAGYASQKISTGLVVGGTPESLIKRNTIWLNQISVLFLPQVSSSYSLSITPARWLKDISINTWQYIGTESDSTELALSEIQSSLSSIQSQLGELF